MPHQPTVSSSIHMEPLHLLRQPAKGRSRAEPHHRVLAVKVLQQPPTLNPTHCGQDTLTGQALSRFPDCPNTSARATALTAAIRLSVVRALSSAPNELRYVNSARMDRAEDRAAVSSDAAREVFARASDLERVPVGEVSREALRQAAAEAGLSEEAVALALAEAAAAAVAAPPGDEREVIVVERVVQGPAKPAQAAVADFLEAQLMTRARDTGEVSLWVAPEGWAARRRHAELSARGLDRMPGVDWVRVTTLPLSSDRVVVRLEASRGNAARERRRLLRSTLLRGGGVALAGIAAGIMGITQGVNAGDALPFLVSVAAAGWAGQQAVDLRQTRKKREWTVRAALGSILDRIEQELA